MRESERGKELTSKLCDDPAQVTNLAELAECMKHLVKTRGMSYGALAKAAKGLPERDGRAQRLPASTLSDMLLGKHTPTKDKLLTLLGACRVPASEIPAWLKAWDKSCVSSMAASKTPPPRPRPWRQIIVSIMATAVTSVAATIFAFWAAATPAASADLSRAAAVVVVQNKWAGGATELIEYDSHLTYLSIRPERCTELQEHDGCVVDGTGMKSGALLPVTCRVNAQQRRYNYNVDLSDSNNNPNKVSSTLYYRGVFPDGRTGYISEVRVAPPSRGGLGLPECT